MNSSIAVPLCLLAAGVLSIVPAQSASADPLPDQSRTVTTEDGWQLTVTKSAENLDRVPNLAATSFSHEGFVSVRAAADITGEGGESVNSGTLTLGYQIGCQIDVSNGISVGLTGTIGPNVNVAIAPMPGVSAGLAAMAMPSVSTTLKPGTITTIAFGTKALTGPHGSITTEQVQIKVDACMGPVSLRSYAIVNISTDTADNSVAVYGDPIWL
ncbi:MspA family porin [Nocardia sp. NBC_00565]|uniref:MspA family porin n=1 Tax=Nocardia sp. NBC_00565 TaxID=2975993 RepID=UPI002E81EC8F|nr:MspA family porin [Nocardia sp. NBC_00565]WUC05905.1 MspA family porin [Nocardia sp. NBC_00565]